MQYLRLPNSKYDIRISPTGELKSFDPKSKTPKTYINHKGYVTSSFQSTSGKSTYFTIHRMVGLLYIEVPNRLKDIPIAELQINHIDGNKLNCKMDNLEWMTNAENMKHARDTGLFSNEKIVLVKSEITGIIERYKSLNEVCRQKNIHLNSLSIHLNQTTAGCIVYNGDRFKFDNDLPWCDLKIHPYVEHKFSFQYKLKGTNKQTNEVWLFRSLPEACGILDLNINIIRNNEIKNGGLLSKDGIWLFEYILDNNLKPKQVPVIRIDKETGDIVTYPSSRICAKENDIDHFKLFGHLTSIFTGALPWKGFYFKFDDGLDFPDINYPIPNASVIGRSIRWIILNVNEDKYYPLTTLADFCNYFNYESRDIYHHLERVGREIPFNNYIFIDVSAKTLVETLAILKSK